MHFPCQSLVHDNIWSVSLVVKLFFKVLVTMHPVWNLSPSCGFTEQLTVDSDTFNSLSFGGSNGLIFPGCVPGIFDTILCQIYLCLYTLFLTYNNYYYCRLKIVWVQTRVDLTKIVPFEINFVLLFCLNQFSICPASTDRP